ncbi:transcriptional regulator [Halobaculum sp. CBA1158]|uniref:HVO_A0114 family putative DNA-binding protein n=1 Tax=Halobaculum sp. CBA1158 TaxID=2904243 RepID=UPI001F221B59|nr:transcriptional regulator [Halobaculum sp. CBA1158]UIP00426.1 transcriptional regulator [Halobaculum sp. CBA1158]
MTRTTLIVTVGSLADVETRSHDAMERALSGDELNGDAPRRITFETADELVRVFSPRAIELLRTIASEEPGSMREAARLVDRDIKDVSRNLDRLAEYDVIEFVEEGRSKRPVVPYDDIRIDLGLRDRDGSTGEPAGA